MRHRILVPTFLLLPSLVLAKGPTADQLKAIKEAELLGRAIHVQDQAASRATDVLLAAVDPDRWKRMIGWVVLGERETQTVTFVGEVAGKYHGLFQIQVKEDRAAPVVVYDPPRELGGLELGMFAARQVAIRSMPKVCPAQYNTVVLPGRLANFDGWLVYLLAASSNRDEIPVGGHFRAHVTMDGSTLISMEPLSKSCLTLARDAQTVALYMTQLMTDTPIETHVFLNLVYGGAFYVATEDTVWGISDGSVRYVGRNKKGK